VTGDAPLLVPEEIDELADAADLARFDYALGVTAEDTLAAYYPHDGRPGIRMTYWDTRDLDDADAYEAIRMNFEAGRPHQDAIALRCAASARAAATGSARR